MPARRAGRLREVSSDTHRRLQSRHPHVAFSKQCGLNLSPAAIEACADDIAVTGLKATKTGITFSPTKPIPEKLVKKLALASKKFQAS